LDLGDSHLDSGDALDGVADLLHGDRRPVTVPAVGVGRIVVALVQPDTYPAVMGAAVLDAAVLAGGGRREGLPVRQFEAGDAAEAC
jgi:hypothetical protein